MDDGGDEWVVWFERHGAALVLLARQWVDCRLAAEDIVQEAFVRFWRAREQVADPAAYLYACVKRCALDSQRGRGRQNRREQAAARPEAEGPFTGSMEDGERRAAIALALRGLPEDQREVLVMKVWGGLTFVQIAQVLQVSANTAASRYRYALAKLREQLAEEFIP
jgi:RNA polymerase sigma-70 factor, ECF subfamily